MNRIRLLRIDIYVNPYERDMIDKIKYSSQGEISSDDEQVKKSLQKILNLNYDGPDAYLVSNRKVVLEECKRKLRRLQKDGCWNKGDLERILKHYETPNENGEYIPFSGVVIWFLKKRLQGN